MWKKVIGILLTVAVFATVLWIADPFSQSVPVQAQDYRNGYSLVPNDEDATGINVDTSFILHSKEDADLAWIQGNLSLDGINLNVQQQDKNEFLITPAASLPKNKLVKFNLVTKEGSNVSWTFQTQMDFAVIGTLPGNTSTNVPVDSGIEIYFTHANVKDIEDYFEIVPEVKGRFEPHGRAIVFVPKSLEKGTLYRVTLKKGLTLENSSQELKEDYTFSFETTVEERKKDEYKGNFYFNRQFNEAAPDEEILLPFNFYLNNNNNSTITINTTIYAFDNVGTFLDAIEKKEAVPYWAYYSWGRNKIDTSQLQKVMDFPQDFLVHTPEDRYIKLPQNLSRGYYLVEGTWDDIKFQTLLQVTDIAMYLTDSNTKTLIWLNSIKNGTPIENATIEYLETKEIYTTNNKGVAMFDTPVPDNSTETERPVYDNNFYFKITAGSDTAILPYYTHNMSRNGQFDRNYYWRYLQTDRDLYKPDDNVSFWGFVKNRYGDKDIENLTVEIGQGHYWIMSEAKYASIYLPYISKPIASKTLKLDQGFYEGSISLPNLDQGGYQITLKYGDQVVNSHYIQVQNYTKPAYKIDITTDKKAVFVGEPVNFTVKTSFFEGTPVSNLDVNWFIRGLKNQHEKTEKTDINGSLVVQHIAKVNDDMQGERNIYFNANATLPESGQINGNANVRVFINNVNAAYSSETKDNIATLKAQLNEIVLDKINNGSNESRRDYLGDPVSGRVLTGKITKHTWVKIEDGDYYDFINKVVKKKYRYEEKKESFGSFSITTDSEGKAQYSFELSNDTNGYYTAEVKTVDNNGRNMKHNVHISAGYNPYYSPGPEFDRYQLTDIKDKYNLDEDIKLTFAKGDTPLPSGNDSYLFLASQYGLNGYEISSEPHFNKTFTEDMIPNMYVWGVYFNGKTYIQSDYGNIVYNYDEKALTITAEMDKDEYRPSDNCIIKLKAVNKDGNPVGARVNMALVDEALFKLNDQYVAVLETLYNHIPSGIIQTYISHSGDRSGIVYRDLGRFAGDDMVQMAKTEEAPMADTIRVTFNESASYSANYTIRQEFKDTAYFNTVNLDSNGQGEIHMKLPDNITSWRVTLAGISPGIHGGTSKAELKVSMPFFINQAMNTTYLAGDKPYIGVSAYGENLVEGETVYYEVTCPQKPDFKQTSEGRAFERVNIPLWALDEGSFDIVIKAISSSGLTDALQQTINVVSTYHEIETAVYNVLKPGLNVPAGKKGLTTLLITDEGRGKLLSPLYSLAYNSGNRLDQKYIAKKASDIIKKYYSVDSRWLNTDYIKLGDYQNPDGGFGILPYSESDPAFTALMTELVQDDVNKNRLVQYFYTILLDETDISPVSALYGLSALGEPVLLELNKLSEIENLDIEDTIFLALAYAKLGETPVANSIFTEKILPLIEEMEPYARVISATDEDEILKQTALACVLASNLKRQEAEPLFKYIQNNPSKEILVNAEKLLYISQIITALEPETVEVEYTYDGKSYTEKLEGGYSKSVVIPSKKIDDFSIDSVKGNAAIISIFKAPMLDYDKSDNNLKIDSSYYKHGGNTQTTTFKQNDIVKVVLNWDILDNAIDDNYVITDYVPSGLKPVDSPWNIGIRPENGYWYFRNIDGQKVTFNVHKNYKEKKPFVYYARVTNPGKFKAEAPIIQGNIVHDSILVGETDQITIEE